MSEGRYNAHVLGIVHELSFIYVLKSYSVSLSMLIHVLLTELQVPRAHMDRADETRPHAYTDREPEHKSTFHMRQLAKAEEADPDR